jgi:glycosyltransferase involved in cell wall biosynthesis
MSSFIEFIASRRPIPLWVIVLVAAAVHGPLLAMRIPENSFDANFHMSMAHHYAHHWFNPWNDKQLGGFSQTTYPPLSQQWVALLSHVVGLVNAYMLVQFILVLLMPVAVFYYSKLWINERAASYAAIASIFLGSMALLVYEAGQLGTLSSTPLYLLSFPFFYRWLRSGEWRECLCAMSIALVAAAAHHTTLLFGSIFFVVPVFWLAYLDRDVDAGQSFLTIFKRTIIFFSVMGVAVVFILLPYFLAILANPIRQTPIPHPSRANYLLEPHWGVHYWIVPMGALILALPFIFSRGLRDRRLFPLFMGFYLSMIFGLGGTTPIPRFVLGRAFGILTFERFTFWASLLAMPFVGLLATQLIDRYRRKAAIGLAITAVGTCALAVSWNVYNPVIARPINLDPIASFLNHNGHDQFRYLTLGFGNQLSRLAVKTSAPSIDGEYNSARWLPEIVMYGSAQLTSAKYFGTEGMEALRSVLKHADRYGLKYVFVRDRYYEPLLTFAGWRQIDTYNNGEVTVWSKPGVPPARAIPSPFKPPAWQGFHWGFWPFTTSIAAIFVAILIHSEIKPLNATHDIELVSPAAEYAKAQPLVARSWTPLKVALVTPFPPSRGDFSEYGYHLADQLRKRDDIQLTIFHDQSDSTERELGFSLQRCWKFNSLSNPFRVLRAARKNAPNVLWFNIGFFTFANYPFAAVLSLACPALARLMGYYTHVTLHTFIDNVCLSDAGLHFTGLHKIGGYISTKLLLMANDVTVLLPSFRELLIKKYGADPQHVHFRPYGIFSDCPEPSNFGRPNSGAVLAFGNWGTYKRVEVLIEAMKSVRSRIPAATLTIAGGDHPNVPGYLESIRKLHGHLPFLRFCDYVPEDEVPDLFSAAAVVILPYTSGGGASGVAHQACMYGVPIVASDLPLFREMAQEEEMAIEFFSVNEPQQLAATITSLLNDPVRQCAIVQQNYRSAQQLTLRVIVDDYVQSFPSAVATSSSRTRLSPE